MLIDELKMAVDISVSILNCRKQQTNLKLKTFYLRLKKQLSLSKIAPLKLITIDRFRSHATAARPPTDT